jgi:hypothetical protein
MLPVMVEGLGCYWEHICGTFWELDENIVRTTRIQKSNTRPPPPPQPSAKPGGKKKYKKIRLLGSPHWLQGKKKFTYKCFAIFGVG